MTSVDDELERAIEAAHDALDDADPRRAIAALDALLAREEGSPALRGQAWGLLAVAARAIGERPRARAAFERGLALLCSEDGDAIARAQLLTDFAELEILDQAPATALALLDQAVALVSGSGGTVDTETWLAIAEAAQRSGEYSRAAQAARRALEHAEDAESRALAIEMSADAEAAAGEPADATYERAIEAWREAGDDEAQARCWLARACLAELREDAEAALRYVAEVEALAPGQYEAEIESILISFDRARA